MALNRECFQRLLGSFDDLIDLNFCKQIVSSLQLFENLTKLEIHKLVNKMKREKFEYGDVIIREGDKDRNRMKFYIIIEGMPRQLSPSN
jgi:signal-transduction protein with cAMP-binding, CBS, and nucleotidyltransferase domain